MFDGLEQKDHIEMVTGSEHSLHNHSKKDVQSHRNITNGKCECGEVYFAVPITTKCPTLENAVVLNIMYA